MITASLVLFNNPPELYGKAIESFLQAASDGLLLVVDNSPQQLRHMLFQHERVKYVFNGQNLGFGRAHNRAIALLPKSSRLHLLLNPDVHFDIDVLQRLAEFMQHDASVGAVMPRISYPDGSPQLLAKLLPTPIDLILRRFIPSTRIRQRINRRYELHGLPQNAPIEVPSLSGCFLLVRTDLLKAVGGFDERYFMYMEDVDLVRRIADHGKTVYVPSISVTHEYAKGSYVNKKLLGYHLKSALQYFSKWGWWFDKVRTDRNNIVLNLIAKQ
jgi:GT2 family glycosyltransferase